MQPEPLEPSAAGKRRKLAFDKCFACRAAKKKCLPTSREWPQKCDRCEERGFECSPPERVDQHRARGSPEPEDRQQPGSFLPHRVNPGPMPSLPRSPAAIPRTLAAKAPPSTLKPSLGPSFVSSIDGKYKFKRLTRGQIRIACLLPGVHGSPIQVEVYVEQLNAEIEPYDVLSWHWDDGERKEIHVTNRGRPDQPWAFLVRPGLHAGLQRLRNPKEPVRLWIDALCIDQPDSALTTAEARARMQEKSEQVCLMSSLIARAKAVVIWVGEPLPANGSSSPLNDSVMAMEFVDKVLSPQKEFQIVGLDAEAFAKVITPEVLHAFCRFVQMPFFIRRWVVQEIALARRATVHYGEQQVDWRRLANAVALLVNVSQLPKSPIPGMLKAGLRVVSEAEGTASMASLPIWRLVQNTSYALMGKEALMVEDSSRASIRLRWSNTLEESIAFLAAFKASSLHDTIYAILGMASDFQPVPASNWPAQEKAASSRSRADCDFDFDFGPGRTPFRVDYEQDVLVLYMSIIREIMSKSSKMDIIFRPWAPTEGIIFRTDLPPRWESLELNLPSWIRSLLYKPFKDISGRMLRDKADPLVGPPVKGQKYYWAALATQLRFEMDLPLKKLSVRGFVLDRVAQTWDAAAFGNVPWRWLSVAGRWKSPEEPPPGELWRTLIANRGSKGWDAPEPWYPLVLQAAAKQSGTERGFQTHDIVARTEGKMAEVFKRIQAVVWERRMMRTEGVPEQGRKGVLGLGPEGMDPGDVVVIVFGCSVPLLLRGVEGSSGGGSGEGEEPTMYSLVGECYVDNMMEGQAMEYFDGANERWFDIK